MIFSVAQIVNYYWDQESVYGKTIECGGMICEREMSLAGDGKQLKKVMTECPMVENSKERKQLRNERRPTVDPNYPKPPHIRHLVLPFISSYWVELETLDFI